MPFCSQCGTKMIEADRFCGSCGNPAAAYSMASASQVANSGLQYGQPVFQPTPTYANQGVLSMLPNAKKMKMMGLYDTFTIVFTADQAIFAKLTSEVLKDAVRKSQEQSKAEGKGVFARIGAQMQAFYNASERYLALTPGQILAEDKNNFNLPHGSVISLKLRRGVSAGDEDGPGDPYIDVEWESQSGKYKFRFDQEEKELAVVLNRFYPGKIRK